MKSNKNKKPTKLSRAMGVAFFPTVKVMSGNPYWPMLSSGLEKKGVIFYHDTPPSFGFKWLFHNRNQIKVLNLHFIQQFYKSSTYFKKVIKLILFAFNLLVARILGYRTIFTLHNLEPTYQVQPVWLDYLGHWCAVNLSERVIVYCNEARRLLGNRYRRRKGVYFVDHPNLINYYPNTISKKDARNQLDLPINSLVFTFIGGVRPNKGVDLLIQAFHKLRDENLRLIIAGNIFPPKDYALSLKEMASVDNRIDFHLKNIPNDEIQVFLNAADIVVLPFSKILTSGTTVLAMSFGRPVIVPKIGCLPELVEPEGGWLFEPGNISSLSETMKLASVSYYHQIGQQAYNKVKNFTIERFISQTIRAYFEP